MINMSISRWLARIFKKKKIKDAHSELKNRARDKKTAQNTRNIELDYRTTRRISSEFKMLLDAPIDKKQRSDEIKTKKGSRKFHKIPQQNRRKAKAVGLSPEKKLLSKREATNDYIKRYKERGFSETEINDIIIRILEDR